MNLSSPTYLLFLTAVFLFYYILAPGRPRRLLLLAASYFFYCEGSGFHLLVLLLVTGITYGGALLLRSPRWENRRGALFAVIISVALLPLIAFKYLGPFLLEVGNYFPALHLGPNGFTSFTFPLGISFFTFAALGYLIDVYLEVLEPEPNFERVALFLSFFPLVTAGPIERGTFMSQFDLRNEFSADKALSGLRLILIGLVLKIIFAGPIGDLADAVFAAPAKSSPLENLAGMVEFAFFLYADFAGYTLIAIGSALMFGLRVRPNFEQPYLSATVPEFWRHWHMSLSFWVRDYIFAPLRTVWRRSAQTGMAAALFISIIVIGVWHGAKWGYLAFGVMNAFLVLGSTFTLQRRDAFWKKIHFPPALLHLIRVLATFSLIVLTFVPFRANTLADAWIMYGKVFSLGLLQDLGHGLALLLHGTSLHLPAETSKGYLLIGLIVLGDILVRRKITIDKFLPSFQWLLYAVAILEILNAWLNEYVPHPFVYNKF